MTSVATTVIILTTLSAALHLASCSGGETATASIQNASHNREALKSELGLEAPVDVYALFKCSGQSVLLTSMAERRGICEVSLEYQNSKLVACTTHVYEFALGDTLSNVGVSSEVEAFLMAAPAPFSFVDQSTAAYSFWLDSEKELNDITCP